MKGELEKFPRAARQPGVTPLRDVVVLAAPSGGGKTTIARELRTRAPENLGYSVRDQRRRRAGRARRGSVPFPGRDEFERRREAVDFLESTKYAGELLRTLRAKSSGSCAAESTWCWTSRYGARQVRKAYRVRLHRVFVIPLRPRADRAAAQRRTDRKPSCRSGSTSRRARSRRRGARSGTCTITCS